MREPVRIVDAEGSRAAEVSYGPEGMTEFIALEALPENAPLLCPGLIDLQVNGGGRLMLGDAQTPEDVLAILAAHRSLGTSAILPTLISDTPDVTDRIIALVSAAAAQDPGILGLHLEGPHLTRAGAHDAALLRPMQDTDVTRYRDAAAQLPFLLMTVAPDRVGPAQIANLVEAGITVSLGHSDCSYELAVAAFEAGAQAVTHLGNAMSGLHHRAPGLMGAALERAPLIGIIADGIHLHDGTLRLAHALAGDRLLPVSDTMAVAGTDLAQFDLLGRTIIRSDGRLTLADGTLAGADLSLLGGLRHLAEATGLDLADILPLGFAHPARLLGLPKPHLIPGYSGPLLRLAPDGTARLAG